MSKQIPNSLLTTEDLQRICGHRGDVTNRLDALLSRLASLPYTGQISVPIYARVGGSDSSGNGSLSSPYRTFQRAVRDVPLTLPVGYRFGVDITGITETLPDAYELPRWNVPRWLANHSDSLFLFSAGVDIQATPPLVFAGTANAADATIAASDIASQTQDTVTQLITLTLNGTRASWGSNALKGKYLCGLTGGNENALICASTTSTLLVATTTALSTPMTIREPGATLTGSGTTGTGGTVGALNIRGDSIGLSGIKVVTTTSGGFGICADGYGQFFAQLCELQNPAVVSAPHYLSRVVRSWMYGNTNRFQGNVTLQSGMLDAMTTVSLNASSPMSIAFRRMVIDGCGPLEPTSAPPGVTAFPAPVNYMTFDNVLIRNTPGATGDGIRAHGGRYKLTRVDIYNCGRDGIRCTDGQGFMELNNVRTTGTANGVSATGYGINVQDGMQVRPDSTTYNATTDRLRGAGGDMIVGANATRTWAHWVAGDDARPAKNENDLVVSGANVSGVGSRIWGV